MHMFAFLIIAVTSAQFFVSLLFTTLLNFIFKLGPINHVEEKRHQLLRSGRSLANACAAPCQRFPRLVKRRRLINIVANSIGVNVRTLFVESY